LLQAIHVALRVVFIEVDCAVSYGLQSLSFQGKARFPKVKDFVCKYMISS